MDTPVILHFGDLSAASNGEILPTVRILALHFLTRSVDE